MGERVVVGRATPVEPIDGSVEPLPYGRGNATGDAFRSARAWTWAVLENLGRLTQLVVAALGGWRRVGFAIGIAAVLAGLGDCIGSFSRGEGVFWIFVGGLLIGLTVRVPLRGD